MLCPLFGEFYLHVTNLDRKFVVKTCKHVHIYGKDNCPTGMTARDTY